MCFQKDQEKGKDIGPLDLWRGPVNASYNGLGRHQILVFIFWWNAFVQILVDSLHSIVLQFHFFFQKKCFFLWAILQFHYKRDIIHSILLITDVAKPYLNQIKQITCHD